MSRDSFKHLAGMTETLRQLESLRDLVDPPALRAIRGAMRPSQTYSAALATGRAISGTTGLATLELQRSARLRDLLDPRALRAMGETMKAARGYSAALEAVQGLSALNEFARGAHLVGVGSSMLESGLRHAHFVAEADRVALASAGISKLVGAAATRSVAEALVVSAGAAFVDSPFDEEPAEIVAVVPPEVFRALDLDASMSGEAEAGVENERRSLSEATTDELTALLAKLDTELVNLLLGARAAVKSANPDRARHVCVSLRELLGHTLRRLATDADVREWTQDPIHYEQTKPTRKARMLCLYARIDGRPLRKFIAADVRAAVELIDVLSTGTHVAALNASDAALDVLFNRAEGMLLLLLKLGAARARTD